MRDQRPPLAALSVIVLSADLAGPPLPPGFADRFRAAWPFARCVFLTEQNDHADLSAKTGLPVTPLDSPAVIIEVPANPSQKIAVQVQRAQGRRGNTQLLETQLEDLVQAGFLTIRVFADAFWRRGTTLQSRMDAMLSENSIHAAAHINVFAVPEDPPARIEANDADTSYQRLMAATSRCRITDPAINQAAAQAEYVIANDLESVGPAVTLFPHARLMLVVKEDRAIALHHFAMLARRGDPAAITTAAAAARFQSQILAIPDLCVFASETEMTRLAPNCRRAVPFKPRLNPLPPRQNETPRFDLLLTGSEDGINLVSLRWFLDRVWRPALEARGLSVAIVGRMGLHAYQPSYASPLLHFLGFVEDLEAIRTKCRLTVIPEAGGAGISMKLLNTLAAGHPLATTRIALRGLDRAIADRLPAFNTADALAADILDMIDNPAHLERRRQLVQQTRDLIGDGTNTADLVTAIPRPTAPGVRKRLAHWSRIAGPAATQDNQTYLFTLGTAFPMSGTQADGQVLLQGWHEPEHWGRWTDGADAALRLTLAAPTGEPLMLELDIVPSAAAPNLRVSIDGTALPLADPVPGPNFWDIPAELSAGKTSFTITLHAGETVCPARLNPASPDDRILGIGVATVRLLSRQPTLCTPNQPMPIRSGEMPSRVLLTGWHAPEDWGCWTSRTTASLRLTMTEALHASIRLELDLALPPVHPALTLTVNGTTVPAIPPADGPNSWDLPPHATNGRSELLVMLTVSKTFSAARTGLSADERELGIGLRGIRVIPYTEAFYEPGTRLELAAGQQDEPSETLLTGWHPPEEWGAWTSQHDAAMRLRLRRPVYGPFRLEMDLMPLPVPRGLTVSVNGQALPMIVPVAGTNRWTLPEGLTNEQQTLLIGLALSDTHSPAELSDSPDNRTLGIGVRGIALHREAAAACPVGVTLRISGDAGDRGMLQAGWHKPEPWGCWSCMAEASILLRFDSPLQGAYAVEMDLAPPLLDPAVTLSVNETRLDTISAVDGNNEWLLPQSCSDGRTQLLLHLIIPRPVRPAEIIDSKDDRILGVGIRSLRLRAVAVA